MVDRIDFVVSNKKLQETRTHLINQAMQDARAKADILASAARMKVVGIRSIYLNELDFQPTFSSIPLARQSAAAGAEQARPTPYFGARRDHNQYGYCISNSIIEYGIDIVIRLA
jgi:uncharacterized protein YggE